MNFKSKFLLNKRFKRALDVNEGSIQINIPIKNGKLQKGTFSIEGLNSVDLDMYIGEDLRMSLMPLSVIKNRNEERVLDTVSRERKFVGNDSDKNESKISSIFTQGNVDDNPIPSMAITTPERENLSQFASEDLPEGLEVYGDEDFVNHVRSVNELIEELERNKHKRWKGKDPSSITGTSPEEEAARESLEQQVHAFEGMDKNAFVVNEKFGNFYLSDVGIQFKLNEPVNLANYSARRLSCSRDFVAAMKNGTLKLLNPDDVGKYLAKSMNVDEAPSLFVGGVDEAEANMYNSAASALNSQEVYSLDSPDDINVDEETDYEEIMRTINSGSSSTVKESSQTRIAKKDGQGGSKTINVKKKSISSGGTKTLSGAGKTNKSGIKTIAKK